MLLQRGMAGQPITLYRASNNDAGEDFIIFRTARVSSFASLGLVSSTVARTTAVPVRAGQLDDAQVRARTTRTTGPTRSSTRQTACPATCAWALAQTAATGRRSCWSRAVPRARTTWVADANATLGNGYVPLINGSDTNVTDPYVLNFPGSATPFQMPTPQLTTWQLQRYPNGGVFNNQLWSADFGPLQQGF